MSVQCPNICKIKEYLQVKTAEITGSRSVVDLPLPECKFFQFHAIFGQIWQNRMLAPSRGLAPPRAGNPGSATVINMSLLKTILTKKLTCGVQLVGFQ